MYYTQPTPIKIIVGNSEIELKNDEDAYAYFNAVANNSPSTDRWRKGYEFNEKVPASEWNWTFGQMTRLLFRMRYDIFSASQEIMNAVKSQFPDATFSDSDDTVIPPITGKNKQLTQAINTAIYRDRLVIAGAQTDDPSTYKTHFGSVATSNANGKVSVDPSTGEMTANGLGDIAAISSLVNKNGAATIAAILSNILNVVYPVGCYYWSSVSTDPATLFGGTWVRVTGRMLYAAEDNVAGYTAGSTGGAKTVTLSAAQIPSHAHGPGTYRITGKFSCTFLGGFHYKDASGTGCFYLTGEDWYKGADDSADRAPVFGFDAHGPDVTWGNTGSNWDGVSSYVGGSGSHENMPPYLAAYCWRRTA